MATRPFRRAVALAAVLALGIAACGEPDDDGDGELAARVAELEAELDDARDQVDDLEAENAELTASLEADDADDVADDDAPDDASDDTTDDAPADDPAPTAEAAQPRTAEGLIDQLRAHLQAGQDDLPDEWEPGATEWEAYDVPDAVQGTYDTPGAVMAALAAETDASQLGQDQWETTIRVLYDEDDEDLAYGAMLSWGFLDDSVAGRDVRITITRTADGWEPGGAEQRFQCLRGVTDDGELCV